MNIFKKIYIKWLIGRHFKKEFVDTGIVSSNFAVIYDKEKKDFCISYTPLNVKNLSEMDEDVVEEEPLNKDIEINE